MKVSFVVPAYNVENYIGECIESIINQTRTNWELIIVDDGSKDKTYEICQQYEKLDLRIKVITQQNSGVSIARNKGIELANGEWLCFIDGDDSVHPQLLEVYWDYLTDKNDVCFISHKEVNNEKYQNIKHSRESVSLKTFDMGDMKSFQIATFNRDLKGKHDFYKVKLSTPVKFYRTKVLLDNQIRFPENVQTGEDAIFNLYVYRYAKRGIYIDKPMYYHRIWSGSVSQKYDTDCEIKFLCMEEHMKDFIKSSEFPEEFDEPLRERKAWTFGFCCLLNYCHKSNPNSYADRKKLFLDTYYDRYENVFNNLDLKHFRIPKRVMFFLIRLKAFWLVSLLCLIKK